MKRIFGKKSAALLLCACMIMLTLPTAAFAAAEYDLWVNNERFTDGKLSVVCGSGTAVYDPAENKLTLNDATITQGYEYSEYGDAAGIYIKIDGLTIELKGDNFINDTAPGSTITADAISTYEIDPSYACIRHDLTVVGLGKLTIDVNAQWYGYGIYCTGDLTLDKVTLDIASSATAIWTQWDMNILNSDIDIEVLTGYFGILTNAGGSAAAGDTGGGIITVTNSDININATHTPDEAGQSVGSAISLVGFATVGSLVINSGKLTLRSGGNTIEGINGENNSANINMNGGVLDMESSNKAGGAKAININAENITYTNNTGVVSGTPSAVKCVISHPSPSYIITLSQSEEYTFTAKTEGYEASGLTALSVMVTNTGNQSTGALNVALSGADADDFILFETPLSSIDTGAAAGFTVTPNIGLGAGTYTATVTVGKATGNTNALTAQSFTLSFTVNEALTKLATPTNLAWGSGEAAGTMSWNAVPGTAFYGIYLYKNGTTDDDLVSYTSSNTTSKSLASSIAAKGAGTYYFKVCANPPYYSTIYSAGDLSAPSGGYVYSPPITSPVTVNGGIGTGNYTEGETVTITANAPTSGKQFKEWTGTSGLTFTEGSAATAAAKFTMPASAVTVTATYEDIPLTPPAIGTPPANQSVTEGVTATFSVVATGNPLPNYMWQINRNDGNGWVDIVGATSASYTTEEMPFTADGYKYRCYISNSEGFVTSAEATLTVTERPLTDPPASENTISGITAGQVFTKGVDVSFTANGGGIPNEAPKTGDRLWRPLAWETNPSGNFDGGYTQSFSTADMTIGEHTLTVTFAQQQYDGEQWADTGLTDTKSVNFTITDNPQTGEGAGMIIFSALILLSSALIAFSIKLRKKQRVG
ncbi:MAG: hypothetical protein GX061_00765 [Eubacteriaceae bacterium]|nr:hypothetical protein [Eubacteriaceae bacterium]